MVKWSYLNYRNQSSGPGLSKVKKYVGFLFPYIFFAEQKHLSKWYRLLTYILQALFEYQPGWYAFGRLCLNISQDDLHSADSIWISARMIFIRHTLFEYHPGWFAFSRLWISARMIFIRQNLFEYHPGWFAFGRLCLNIGRDDLHFAGYVWISARMTCILEALNEGQDTVYPEVYRVFLQFLLKMTD